MAKVIEIYRPVTLELVANKLMIHHLLEDSRLFSELNRGHNLLGSTLRDAAVYEIGDAFNVDFIIHDGFDDLDGVPDDFTIGPKDSPPALSDHEEF